MKYKFGGMPCCRFVIFRRRASSCSEVQWSQAEKLLQTESVDKASKFKKCNMSCLFWNAFQHATPCCFCSWRMEFRAIKPMVFGVITPDTAWHVTNDLQVTLGQVWGFCRGFEACLLCSLMPTRPVRSPPLPAYHPDKLNTCSRKKKSRKIKKKTAFCAQSKTQEK